MGRSSYRREQIGHYLPLLFMACAARADALSETPERVSKTRTPSRVTPPPSQPASAASPSPPQAVHTNARATSATPLQKPSDEQQTLSALRRLYDEGMSYLQEGKPGNAAPRFSAAIEEAQQFEEGAGLFEQRPDGLWQYRRDEISELYALAAYRSAVLFGTDRRDQDRSEREKGSERHFCLALEARPDVILPLVKQEGLTPRARRIFNRAKRNHDPMERNRGGTCYVIGGWRSTDTKRPRFADPNDPLL